MNVESIMGLKVSDKVVSEFFKSIDKVKKTTFGLHHLNAEVSAEMADVEVQNPSVSNGRKFRVEAVEGHPDYHIYSSASIPYIEPRVPFSISKAELQMIEEGLEPFELSPLEEAMKTLLKLEEEAFFKGFNQPGAKGLYPILKSKAIETDGSPQSMINSLLMGAVSLKDHFVESPYRIVMGKDLIPYTAQLVSGRTLASIIEAELGEEIEVSNVIQGGVLLPVKTDDIVIENGKALTLVVDHMTDEAVHFYLTESFRIQYLNDHVAMPIQLSN